MYIKKELQTKSANIYMKHLCLSSLKGEELNTRFIKKNVHLLKLAMFFMCL